MKELAIELIQLYPSNYQEMHEKKDTWADLSERFVLANECLNQLKNQREDEESLQLLAQLSHNMGVFCMHVLGNYPQAIQLFLLALNTKKAVKSTNQNFFALTHTQLADCAYRNGNYVLAIEHFNLSLGYYKGEQECKEIELQQAFVLHASGNAYYNVGAYAKALSLFSDAKKIRLKHLPESDIEFGYLEHDKADVLAALGYYEKAQDLFSSSLTKKENYFKTNMHTNIALLYQGRALMYIKSYQFNKAKTDLDQALMIYTSHYTEFPSAHQPDIFRNDFYTIMLQLSEGFFEKAEVAINRFELQLNEFYKDTFFSCIFRLMHEKIQLYQHQNKLDHAITQLEEFLQRFIPGLKFEIAEQVLDIDDKFFIAGLLSIYGLLQFIQNDYQNFDDTLKILELSRRLKEQFYHALASMDDSLGTINYAFSDYDMGLLYYLSGLANNEMLIKYEKLQLAQDYFQNAKDKFLIAGMAKTHNNIIACHTQLDKIQNLLLNPTDDTVKEEHSINTISGINRKKLNKRILFFTYPLKENKQDEKFVPYPHITLNYYP